MAAEEKVTVYCVCIYTYMHLLSVYVYIRTCTYSLTHPFTSTHTLTHTLAHTQMLRKTGGKDLHLCNDILRYHRSLGPILMDGSLMEWLISSGHETELRLLLHLRPSVALLELPVDSTTEPQSTDTRKTPFELAILLRRDKTLEALLHAAARYAKNGEPAMAIRSKAGTSKKQGADVQLGRGLLPPAMRHVTDCLRDALRSQDHMMAEVLRKFLMTLEPVPFDTAAKYLPRTLKMRFLGSPSPSLQLSNPQEFDLNAPLWCQHEDMHVPAGFPSSASVVMLPGLTAYSVLDILAQQEAAFLYTPPVRTLIDALKTNGIRAEFYRQSYLFVILFLCFILMVFSLVMDAQPGIDMYSLDKMQRSPRIILGLVTGLISFVLAIKFLVNEANELIESTDDVVDIDTQTAEILRMEDQLRQEEDLVHIVKTEGTDLQDQTSKEGQQRKAWMRRSKQRLFPAGEAEKSTAFLHQLNKRASQPAKASAGGSQSAKASDSRGSDSRGSAFLFGSSSGRRPKKYQHPVMKQLVRRSEAADTHVDRIAAPALALSHWKAKGLLHKDDTIKQVRVHPSHDAGAKPPQDAAVEPRASSADVSGPEKGDGDAGRSSGGGDGSKTGETDNCHSIPSENTRKSVTVLAKSHTGTKVHFLSDLDGEQASAFIPAGESTKQLTRRGTMPVAPTPKKKGTMARIARTLRSLDIDVTYFQSGWNWMGLSSFILVLTTCICYVLGAMCNAKEGG